MKLATVMMAMNAEQRANGEPIIDGVDERLDEQSKTIVQQQMSPIKVSMEGDSVGVSHLQQQLERYGDDQQVPPFLVDFSQVEQAANPDYRVLVSQRCYEVYQGVKQQPLFSMVKYYNTDSEHQLLQQLKQWARWQQKLDLYNPYSKLPTDAVSIVTEYEGCEAVDNDLLLCYQPSHDSVASEAWQQPRFRLKITLSPQIKTPLYCALFYFDAQDAYIGTELLSGVWLVPNQTMEAWAFGGQFIPTSVSEQLRQQGVWQTKDFIKLIASEDEFDATLLQQQGVSTRGMRVKKRVRGVDWLSKSIRISTIYPLDSETKVKQGKQGMSNR